MYLLKYDQVPPVLRQAYAELEFKCVEGWHDATLLADIICEFDAILLTPAGYNWYLRWWRDWYFNDYRPNRKSAIQRLWPRLRFEDSRVFFMMAMPHDPDDKYFFD